MIDFIKSLVIKAGEELKHHRLTITREKKSGVNWTTEADVAVEQFIVNRIRAKYPSHFIFAEERALSQIPKKKERIWFVDPLDGTTNAVFGVPLYGISVAYMKVGEIFRGAILDVPANRLYWVEKGKGAFVDDKQIKVRAGGLRGALTCTGAPYGREDFQEVHRYMDKIHAAGARIEILGSTVVIAGYVAEGRYSLFYEVGLKPWDIAAASLLVEGAEGVARSFEGEPNVLNPRTFVCGSKTVVNEFLSLL